MRARIHALAKQSGRSAHSFIPEAVERHADYEEQMRSLVKEALAADEEIERTGEVYRVDDVHAMLASQHYGYLLRELDLILTGERGNSNPAMPPILRNYATDDKQAIAAYLAQLPPPGTAVAREPPR